MPNKQTRRGGRKHVLRLVNFNETHIMDLGVPRHDVLKINVDWLSIGWLMTSENHKLRGVYLSRHVVFGTKLYQGCALQLNDSGCVSIWTGHSCSFLSFNLAKPNAQPVFEWTWQWPHELLVSDVVLYWWSLWATWQSMWPPPTYPRHSANHWPWWVPHTLWLHSNRGRDVMIC